MSFSETAIYFKERFCLPDSLDVIKAEWISMSREKYAHEVPLKPGAREFLEYLKAHGIKAGIATSNGRELLDAVVEGQKMTPYFQCLMTYCEAGAGQPAPDIYLKVAAELGVAPEDCLVDVYKRQVQKIVQAYETYEKAQERRSSRKDSHDYQRRR